MPDASDTKRRLRVLTLVDRLGTSGGGEKLAMRIATRLDRERFESWYCASRWSGGEPATEAGRRAVEELRSAGVHAIGLGRQGARSLTGWGSLVRLMRRERIDVLHSHKFGSNAWGAVLAPLGRVPVFVAHEHTWSYEGQPVRRFVDRELIARRSAAFVAVSREDRRRMIEVEGIAPGDVTFVANGIDAVPAGDRERVRSELGIPDGAPLLGAVAVLREQKGLDVLVRALSEVLRDVPDARLAVAGEGPERASLEALAAELAIGPRVMLLGNRSDVPDLLAGFDVAVSASWFEGSPLAAMEYMDAGLPIVATRVGGMPDLIDDGVHGRLVEPGDAEGIAAAVVDLLRDGERARAMGERARERRRAEFDLDGTVRTLESMYERLVAERGRAS
ncbi:MAG TPA: glycosyltransferase [Thermoleophilaceae bacterium]|nr:glycosyltransferase [Thermoleophilaceae bacterium]